MADGERSFIRADGMNANETLPFVPSLYFYQYCFQIGACSTAFCLQCGLLWTIFGTGLRRQLSANLIVNIVCWCCVTFAITLHAFVMGRFGPSEGKIKL